MRFGLVLSWLALVGCTSEDPGEPPVVESSCLVGEIALPDGSCIAPGLHPEHCGAGFVHDGAQSCTPVLPAEACGRGLMAVPGDAACRPIMECGSGKWGSLVVDAATMHVDAAYAGTDSDGSAARPWKTIGAAYAASAPGGFIAVAEGRYVEDLVISKAVRLWGVCPDKVELTATGTTTVVVPLVLAPGAHGTEVGGVAVTGEGVGIHVSGAEHVRLDRIWIHDNPMRGINVEDGWGPVDLELVDSLLEDNADFGLYLGGTGARVERTVVRGTVPGAYDSGCGINAQLSCDGSVCNTGARSRLSLVGALLDDNHDLGLLVAASDASVESTVVRGTRPRPSDARGGWGVQVAPFCSPAGCDASARGTATITGSLIDRNHELGLAVLGSDATITGLVVRATLPRASDQQVGRGINVQLACTDTTCDPLARANATIVATLVENNHDTGLFVGGSEVILEDSVVRDTLPQASDQLFGRGMNLQPRCAQGHCDPLTAARGVLRRSLIEGSYDVGIFVGGSDLTLESTVVRNTQGRQADAYNGDGVTVLGDDGPASATIGNTRIEDSARAGLSSFGATISLGSSWIDCAAFALEGEPWANRDFIFDDRGGNRCGCPVASGEGACKVVTNGIAPPAPVDDVAP